MTTPVVFAAANMYEGEAGATVKVAVGVPTVIVPPLLTEFVGVIELPEVTPVADD